MRYRQDLDETNAQISVLEEVFELLDMKPRGKHCAGIAGIFEDGSEASEEHEKSPLLDAALVGGGKRAKHYEIAAYTSLIAMGTQLGHADAVPRFEKILSQEVACDAKLDTLARLLLPIADGADEADDEDAKPCSATRKAANVKSAAKH